ncbi:hypothetical protein FJZ53_05530 [Candidatus Woesearchaeota archaeon]|nr:hypothetical protein [Candidatus Woesearchaeota archaeon]
MNEDLESKIKERKKQAERRKISSKAWAVAKYLGDRSYYRTSDGHLEQTTYTFEKDDFLITNEFTESHGHDGSMGGGSTTVDYRKKTVFYEAGAGIISYIPGDWEKKLTKLYGQAVKASEQKAKEEEEKRKELAKQEEDKEKAKWGL